MILQAYPPSGLRISLPVRHMDPGMHMPVPPDVCRSYFVDSGAAAILTVLRAIAHARGCESKGLILPAYCCPRVLGAVLGAGWRAILIDVDDGAVSIDVSAVEKAVGGSGVDAVMTVDMFGLSGAPPELRELTRRRSLPLIRDLAQCAPSDVASRPLDAEVAILSFGRGKPISLLGGGAILLSQAVTPAPTCQIDRRLHFGTVPHLALVLRMAAYNVAVGPVSFALLRKIPWLRIGESSLVITDRAVRYSKGFEALVAHQILVAERTRVRREAQVKKLAGLARRLGLQAVKGALSDQVSGSASRVPVLAPTAWHADQAAKAAGHLGVSRMYKKTLAEFVGTSAAQAMHTWPSAYDLSRRLLTLPAHGRLPEASLLELEETLGVVLAKNP